MGHKYLLAVDLGTQINKAGIFNLDGYPLAIVSEESPIYHPKPEYSEKHPEENFYNSTCRMTKKLLSLTNINPSYIVAVSIDSLMGGILAIDEDWNAVTHYDSLLDPRCIPYTYQMQKICGDLIFEKGGTVPYWGQKILWWQHECPEVFKKICKFVEPSGYVAGKLVGLRGEMAFIDYTTPCWSGLSDTKYNKWSKEICDALGIPLRCLPEIVEPFKVVGEISELGAKNTGLNPGTPVAAGCGDQAAAILGAGVVKPGLFFDSAGSACVFGACVDDFLPDVINKTLCFMPSVKPGFYTPIAFVMAGVAHKWYVNLWQDKIKASANVDIFREFDEEAQSVPIGSNGVIFFPYIGGRNCPSQPYYRAGWLGIDAGVNRGTMYRAILEAVAYEYSFYLERLCSLFPNLQPKEIRVVGGGARSDLWNQIKSNVLNIPYVRLEQEDLALLGGALIAGHSIGLIKNIENKATEWVKIKKKIQPSQSAHVEYRRWVELYIDTQRMLDSVFKRIAKARKTIKEQTLKKD